MLGGYTGVHQFVRIGHHAFIAGNTAHAAEIFSDNFNDNDASDWTFIDRSADGDEPVWLADGSGAVGAAGQLAQTATNPGLGDPSGLGAIALAPTGGVVGGTYTISLIMESLETGNDNQDQHSVFGYEGIDDYWHVDITASGADVVRLMRSNSVDGVRTVVTSNQNIAGGFKHGPTNVVLTVNTATQAVLLTVGAQDFDLSTFDLNSDDTFGAGLVGVGTQNDAFQVDDFVVTQIPEPTSLALLSLGGLAMIRRRRCA